MAENTIDNLSIQVTASAENAVRVFDRLASSAGRLRGAASGATGGMRDMAQGARDAGTATATAGEQAGRAQPRIRGVGNAAKDAGDKAKKGSNGLKTFWESLKRIAFYRFVRSVIRSITDAFKTGITNLYQWSAAVNGTFAKSMDRIATSTLYLKNSLGAMLAPLINTLAPVIEWIIDRIVDVINWINKLFAALSGSQTYTVAKKVATTWSDAGKSAAGSAKKAADDIKRTILGFDEINKLEKQNTSSYGGGSSSASSGPNYKDMFEERRLDGWMSKLASLIDKFNLQIPAIFGSLLAGWAAVKLAIKGVAELSLGWLKDMASKSVNIAVSLIRKGWTTIKSWALKFGEAVVDLAVRIKTSAAELWAKFAAKWAALSPVLKVGIATTITAATLWGLYKLAWALVPDKVLQIKAAISTTAMQLKNTLVLAWATLGYWALGVKLRVATTAAQLKNEIISGWNNLSTWTLGVALRLATSAVQLKNDIVNAWNKLTSWALGVKLRIETSIKKLWDWVKENWRMVAAVGLGVAIAIATPWATIAASLSALWGEVMASFGGALAFAVTPTLNTTDNYGISGNPAKFNKKQAEIRQYANELRGTTQTKTAPSIDTSKLTKGVTALGGLAAVAGLASSLFSGGASNALASIFMPGMNSAADKSPLSPKTSYYNNMTGELVVPKSVDVGVNFTSAANSTYKNNTLGNYLVDTMSKVKSEAKTRVSSIAGAFMETVGSMLKPIVDNTFTTNTVNSAPGIGMVYTWDGYVPITSDTATTNVVNSAPGVGMVYTWDGYMPEVNDTATTNVVNGSAGTGMANSSRGYEPIVNDTSANATINAVTSWGWQGLRSYLGLDRLNATANIDAMTPWWYWHKSVIEWLGLDNLQATVRIGATVSGVATAVSSIVRSVVGRANGGVFSNGVWSSIPKYAGGTAGVNHGSLFWAGEHGAEIVGTAGGRTEVLNKSQIASAVYSAVQAAMAPAAANFAAAAQSMNSAEAGLDLETLAEMVRQGVEQAMSRSNDLDRQRNDLLRQINEKDYNLEIGTYSINKAQQRMNRRAGTTIIPIGT